jgi:hypothetical protein
MPVENTYSLACLASYPSVFKVLAGQQLKQAWERAYGSYGGEGVHARSKEHPLIDDTGQKLRPVMLCDPR